MRKKKRSWFSLVKSLFISEPKSKTEKRSKRWRWVFGKLKPKQYPTLAAAPERLLSEAREEQRKHAMAVAIATAAAAEAAVAAARAAAEVVHLTGVPQSFQDYQKMVQNSAAIRIQAAYRAHLARKALKALKGLVRLQAMVRGRIVRRVVIPKLKSAALISKLQSQVQEVRVPNDRIRYGEKKQFLTTKEELEERQTNLLRCKSQKYSNYSLIPKEDMEALWLQKHEVATMKREGIKKYSFSHWERRSDQNVESGRWSNPSDQRVAESEARKRREMLNLKSTVCSNTIARGMYGATTQMMMKQRNSTKQDSSVGELNSPFILPRRSFSHTKNQSIGEESSLPNSPNFPTYMAATESAKAKARSMSTPKQRLRLFDTYAEDNSPCKFRLSSWSSFNGELISKNGGGRGSSGRIL